MRRQRKPRHRRKTTSYLDLGSRRPIIRVTTPNSNPAIINWSQETRDWTVIKRMSTSAPPLRHEVRRADRPDRTDQRTPSPVTRGEQFVESRCYRSSDMQRGSARAYLHSWEEWCMIEHHHPRNYEAKHDACEG